jgi:hypothetical protein
MQRFEICDFVCKKVCIEWERASSGELQYVTCQDAHRAQGPPAYLIFTLSYPSSWKLQRRTHFLLQGDAQISDR